MATTDLATRLTELLEPIAEREGFDLVAVEQSGGRHTPVIRVLLDKEGGLDLDAICSANRWVSEAIDEQDPINGPYTLEVSSPGVDRPLRKASDFERFAGEQVTIKTKALDGERATWTGTLLGIEDGRIKVDVEGDVATISFDDIVKARLKGVVSFNERGTQS